MRTGPLPIEMGGRIWAHAFLNAGFRKLLEESLRDATAAFFSDRVNPLFDYQPAFFTAIAAFSPAEQLQIQNGTFTPTTDPRYQTLRMTLTGNGFTIVRGITPIYAPPLRNDIDGSLGLNLPLNRDQWVRVYAKTHLEPAYKARLQRIPAEAIDEFTALGHNSGAPLFKFPTLAQLLAKIPAGDVLKDQDTLEQTLRRIANATDPSCEGNLEITLTC